MNSDGVALNGTSRGGSLTWILLILLTLLPLMQIGISYYLSFQMLGFSLVLLALRARAIKQNIRIGFILFVLMMLPNVFFAGKEQFFHYVLVSARSFLCLYVMLSVFDMARMKPFNINKRPLKIVVNLLIVFLFLSVVLQSILLKEGILLTTPIDYLIANADTLPGEFELEHGSLIRPTSTFGEPSYLGFISLSLFMVVMYLFEKSRLKVLLLVLLFATVVMAQTLSGVLSLALIWVVHYSRYLSRKQMGRSIAVLAVVGLGALALGSLEHLPILVRLFDIFDPDAEFSGYIRLVVPLAVAMNIFSEFFIFGVPLGEVPYVVGGMGLLPSLVGQLSVTDNGLLNLFMSYGVSAVLIIWVVSRKIASPVLLVYLFLSSMFNGAFLSFDKAAVFAVVFLLTNVVAARSGAGR